MAEAAKIYEEILAADGAHFDALHLLGVIALQNGRELAAIELLSRAIAAQPRAAQPFDPTGLLARFKGDPVKAGQFLKAMESDLAHRLAGLREAVGAGDALLAGRSAHALKGLPGGIPLPGLREGVLVLEEAIRTDAPWQEPARSLAAGLSRILAGFPRLPLSGGTAGPR